MMSSCHHSNGRQNATKVTPMKPEKTYPSALADKFQLRMPEGLRPLIGEAAKAGGRSMNTEIVMRLQRSLATYPVLPPAPSVMDEAADYTVKGGIHAVVDSLSPEQVSALQIFLLAMRAGERSALARAYVSQPSDTTNAPKATTTRKKAG